jgi:hypothetical protein
MLEFLLETKKEYMELLKSSITLKIYNKFVAIYDSVKKEKDYLKSFQENMLKILQWDANEQFKEKQELFNKNPVLIEKLCKGLMKSYMRILLFNPYVTTQKEIESKYYDEFNTTNMVVNIIKQTIRNFWDKPYLFNDKSISDFEYKINQHKITEIIKKSIEEGFRESLPTEYILTQYLEQKDKTNMVPNNMVPNNMVPNNMVPTNINVPNNMVSPIFEKGKPALMFPINNRVPNNMVPNNMVPNNINVPANMISPIFEKGKPAVMIPINNMENAKSNNIDDILKNNEINLTDTKNNQNIIVDEIDMENKKLDNKQTEKISENKTEKTENKEDMETNIDSKINKILENDLQLKETNNITNNNIIEKFSNSEVNKKTDNNDDNFFGDYLNNI